MRILFVVGSCLTNNSSANLCHQAYIRGAVNLGYNIDVLSMSENVAITDTAMKLPSNVSIKTYNGSLYTTLSRNKNTLKNIDTVNKDNKPTIRIYLKKSIRYIKNIIIKSYGIYGFESVWAKKAIKYKNDTEYDYVISLAWPPASHLLVKKLIDKKHIKCKHWYQIWEDPWATDLWTKDNLKKQKEEKKLVSYPDKIIYVSPLTLEYQKELYPESAHNMVWYPLPYYYKNVSDNVESNKDLITFGYYGDYYSHIRNLKPFYEAAKELKTKVNIFGNTGTLFRNSEYINVKPRVSLNELKKAEDQTDVLVFLCNLKGGQIPGKIYQYSATNKIILFILDGTENEMAVLKKFFSKYNRYIFCYNTKESISMAIKDIISGNLGNITNEPIESFSPSNIMKKILGE